MELLKARNIAVEYCYRLQPFSDRVNIAGSIRRQKPDVKDIEIVCQPKSIHTLDMFGETSIIMRSEEFTKEVMQLGKVIKGKPSGRYMQIGLKEGITLDLFIPQPHDYFRMLGVRTGSSNFSKLFIATGWINKGWCGTENGLRKINQCTEKKLGMGKSIWFCNHPNPELPPHWQSEKEFFDFIGLQWIRPEQRNI